VIARNGEAIWRHVNRPRLTMRPLSDDFIHSYLDQIGQAAFDSVGAYQLEGLGVQLFSRIEGDYFSILGLPLIELLTYLRDRGDIPS
jgi:septum formation protein